METASFAGVLKTIFYVILFYYILKLAIRLLLPIILKKAVQKAEENLRKHHSQPEIDPQENLRNSKGNPRARKQVGEYVDYEEIE